MSKHTCCDKCLEIIKEQRTFELSSKNTATLEGTTQLVNSEKQVIYITLPLQKATSATKFNSEKQVSKFSAELLTRSVQAIASYGECTS